MKKELVHAMLKPDALEYGLRDTVIAELQQEGQCEVIVSRRLILDSSQIEAIYSRFSNKRAKPVVFNYFTSRETEHLAIGGGPGLHHHLDVVKGQTGTGRGIRGKYYTRYTRLSPEELEEWLAGTLVNATDIDLEMFGRDILHVADTIEDSLRGLREIMTVDQLNLVRLKGYEI